MSDDYVTVTLDMDARQHQLTLADLWHIAEHYERGNENDRLMAARLRDLRDRLTLYEHRRASDAAEGA